MIHKEIEQTIQHPFTIDEITLKYKGKTIKTTHITPTTLNETTELEINWTLNPKVQKKHQK